LVKEGRNGINMLVNNEVAGKKELVKHIFGKSIIGILVNKGKDKVLVNEQFIKRK